MKEYDSGYIIIDINEEINEEIINKHEYLPEWIYDIYLCIKDIFKSYSLPLIITSHID